MITLFPDGALQNLAMLNYQQGKLDEAIRQFRRALSTGLATFTLAGHAKTHFENSISSLLTQGRKDLTSPKKHMQRAVTGNFAEGRDGDFRRGTLIIGAAENSPSPSPKHFPDFIMASTSS